MSISAKTEPGVIEVARLPGPVGARVTGVDLSIPMSAEIRQQINTSFLEHGLLWFPNQMLSPSQQASFAENFGTLGSYPFVTPLAENDKVVPIIKEPETKMNFGGGWHTDTSYLPKPCLLYTSPSPRDQRGSRMPSSA